jgi:prevent-host-death family protein
MKTVGIREAKASLSKYVARAQHERVLIMKHGKPAALVIGIEGQDLEDVLRAHDRSFWKLIHQRRREGATISLDQARRRLGISKKKSRRRRQGPRRRRVHVKGLPLSQMITSDRR